MGQIFNACIYDTESMTYCTCYADKFYSNCYSFSEAVCTAHYLLRQKQYRVMWGGDYVVIDDYLEHITREEDLLGLSTYLTYDSFECNNSNLKQKSYYDKVQFIENNSGRWKRINVEDKVKKYFDWDKTRSVKYEGYLLNHTKKIAADLADYYQSSNFWTDDGSSEVAVDALPVLTETGGGTCMLSEKRIAIDTTKNLDGVWCGDLLQIVDDLPEGYEIRDCSFFSHRYSEPS